MRGMDQTLRLAALPFEPRTQALELGGERIMPGDSQVGVGFPSGRGELRGLIRDRRPTDEESCLGIAKSQELPLFRADPA